MCTAGGERGLTFDNMGTGFPSRARCEQISNRPFELKTKQEHLKVEEAAVAIWVEVSRAKVAKAVLQDFERVGLLTSTRPVHTGEESEPEEVLCKPTKLWRAGADQFKILWKREVADQRIHQKLENVSVGFCVLQPLNNIVIEGLR